MQVWLPPRELFLPVHADGELQLVPAAGHCGLAGVAALCAAYLQVRLQHSRGLTANFTLCADCFTLITYQLSSASLQDELTPGSAAVAVMTFLMPESP